MKQGAKEFFRLLALVSSMGLAMVLATVIGLAAGYFLDQYFGTSPVLTLIFLVLGIIAGFRNLYVIMKRTQRMEKELDERSQRK